MPSIDMPIEQLRQYKPSQYREPDFEEFWDSTAADARRQPLNAELIPYNLPARGVECYAVRYDGFGGGRIAGWYLRPASVGRFPGVCMYHGYNNRAARPLETLHLAAQGVCVLSMDCRGQNGQSQDANVYPEGHYLGWMTQGIRDPRNYVYRYVYADAARAWSCWRPARKSTPTGSSSRALASGGISMAVSALSDRPALSLPDIPFLCDFRRGMSMAQAGPYQEIPGFLKAYPHLYDQTIRTLSYFDNINLASWVRCRTVVLNCLWDDICPPSTVFGAYNHITSEKQMEVYPFHKHEVPHEHLETKFRMIMEMADE